MADNVTGKTDNHPQPVSPDLYTEEYFLTACEGYEDFINSDGENLSRRLKAAFELAAVEPGMKVLDVACGRGEIVRHCAQLGADAYGFDYAHAAIKLSKQILGHEETKPDGVMALVQAEAKKYPFPDNAFDRVLMFDIVEHLHPWELQSSLLEVRRVMKDDGRLIIHTDDWSRWQGEPSTESLHEVTEADLQTGGQYERLGAECGFGAPLTLNEYFAEEG